ncbi:MAG: AAA family ATPase, partial [Deltaproteobacteria bacterium]|nr:AAA family ATPase [Deltaproteobacteria bacterium]
MNDEQKKLPLFDPTFREIIQGNFLYADKTIYIHKMIDKYKCCFLSRPRRFGKTLLLDTVDELFSGNSELFEGLWIDTDSSYEFVRHPVLRFSMTYTKISTKDDLEARIETDLRLAAKKEKIELISDSYGEMLVELLDGICDKYGVGAVVLIDEYDAPVAGNISNQRLAADNCKVLHGFYTSLKKGIRHVRFALVTGITRFAMTALDSGPNNFMDISLKSDFSGICGFPVSELESLFGDRFDETLDRLKSRGQIGQGADKEALKAVILKWYDGYNWLGPEHVLNPYSILNFFDDKDLRGYWPLSGHPSHLMALVRERPLEFIQPSVDSLFSQNVRRADLGTLEAVPLLFHSGYLTIDKKELKDTGENDDEGEPILEEAFTFRNPNQEVRALYKSSLFKGA